MLRFKKSDGSDYPEWEICNLEEISSIYDGTHQTPNYVSYGVPFVSVENIDDIKGTDKYISNEAFDEFKVKPQINDIFMTRITAGIIGATYVVADNEPLGYYVSLALIRPKKNVEAYYLSYFINCRFFKKELYKRIIHTAFPKKINKEDIGKCVVKVPCIEEQKKISTLFSSVDEVISAIESEVALWEEKKKGVMQKIFSQEVRFKKEDGSEYPEWEEKSFYDVFDLLKNNTFSRAELNYEKGKAKNIHYGDVLIKFPCLLDVEDISVPYVTNDEMAEKKMINALKDGDVIIADTAEDETVGKAIEVYNIGENKVLSGLHTIPIRAKKNIFSIGYLGYFINTELYHDQLRPLMQGIKVTSISKSALSETIIYYPCIEEQKKIVDCLLTMDEVIKIKKQKLETWKTIKKGLLQQMFV